MAETILQTLEETYDQLKQVDTAIKEGTNPQITTLANGVTAKGGTNEKLDTSIGHLKDICGAITEGTNPQITTLANGVTAKGGTNEKLDESNETLSKVHLALQGPNGLNEKLESIKNLIGEGNKHTEHLLTHLARIDSGIETASNGFYSLSQGLVDFIDRSSHSLKLLYDGIAQLDRRFEAIGLVLERVVNKIERPAEPLLIEHLERMRELLASIHQELSTPGKSQTRHHQKGND